MAWKQRRNGHRYYYRSRREGGRVVSEYVGAGPRAEASAADVAARQSRRAAERDERARLDSIARAIAEQKRIANAAVGRALESCGYHCHKRQWRKKRRV